MLRHVANLPVDVLPQVGADRREIAFPCVSTKVDVWTDVLLEACYRPVVTLQLVAQKRGDAAAAAQLTELQHQPSVIQMFGEGCNHFTLATPFRYHIEIIRSDRSRAQEFQHAWSHSSKLRRPLRERQDSHKLTVIAHREDRQTASFSEMLPPGRQPLVRQKHAVGSAGFEQRVPFVSQLEELFRGVDNLKFHI